MSINFSSYNIVFLGKTGVGKSSLINYLFDTDVAPTGLGKPVTPFGFHVYTKIVNDINFNFYDSSGIEVENYKQWIDLLSDEFSARDVSKPAFDWFHAMIYGLSCAGRFEEADEKIIKQCVDKGYHVIISLTWADSISKEKIDAYKDVIYHSFNKSEVTVIPVCSVASETMFGHTKRFGRDEMMNSIVENFWHLIMNKLPKRCTHIFNSKINSWRGEQGKIIDNMLSGIIGYFTINSTQKAIKENCEIFTKDLEVQITEVIKQESILTFSIFDHFSKSLNISTELDLMSLTINPGTMQEKEQFWNLLGGIVFSGLGFFILEIFGMSKFMVSGSIEEALDAYVANLRSQIDDIEIKFHDRLEKNITIRLQKK